MATAHSSPILTTPAAILSRIIRPEEGNFSPEAAAGLLQIRFEQGDLDRMHDLASKNQEGMLDERERAEMENYRQVGYFLDLVHSKARRALMKRQMTR